MAKKDTGTSEKMNLTAAETAALAPDAASKAAESAPAKPELSGIYCYIGPNLAGLMQSGKIFRGTRADALKEAAAAIEKYPLVKTMIVTGEELAFARMKVKTPGNALYKNYQRIAAAREEKV